MKIRSFVLAVGGVLLSYVGRADACVCDCPNGPPPPPLIDTFCASADDGETCCLSYDGSSVGVCVNNECAPLGTPYCGPWEKPFGGYDYCYEPNCCSLSEVDLGKLCEQQTSLPVPVVCKPEPQPGIETDYRECASLYTAVVCSWDEPIYLNVLCCEE